MADEMRPGYVAGRLPKLTRSQRDALLAVALGAVRATKGFEAGSHYVAVSSPGTFRCPAIAQPLGSCRALERLGLVSFPPGGAQGYLALTAEGRARFEGEFPPETVAAVAASVETVRVEGIRSRADWRRRQLMGDDANIDARRAWHDLIGDLVIAREAARNRVHAAAFALGDGANDTEALLDEIRAQTRAVRAAEKRIAEMEAERNAALRTEEARIDAILRAEMPEAFGN